MFSRSSNRRSIASQLVLLFTLSAALLLTCSLGAFYWMVVRHAFAEDNAVLEDKLVALRADLKRIGGPKALADELKSMHAGEHTTYWIRILDSTGRIVTETPGMTPLLPASVFSQPDSTNSKARPRDYRSGPQLFSLITTAEEANGERYTIQLAQDRSADQQFQKEFGILLGIVLAFGLLASTVIGFTLTNRGLRPLAEMKSSLERIEPTHLNERVAPHGWPTELEPLALAFDDVLGRLENSFTRLSQFSADLAHELRTPLANMLGEAQVTLTRDRTSEEYRSVIESTVAECERLSGIVDNLLFVARVDAARENVQRTTFNGRAAIEKIASYYQSVAEDRQVVITCAGEAKISADPTLFDRALSNLMDNALRFTARGGTIQISVTARNDYAEAGVHDSGCGIPPEHLSRVFDRFYRADSSRSSGSGAGLGLSLVKSIADLHGGTTSIQSELNRGTTVTITFPNAPLQ